MTEPGGVSPDEPKPLLDLNRPRNVGELLEATFKIFGANFGVLYTLTLIVIGPAMFLVDGVWGDGLKDGWEAEPPVEQILVSSLLNGLVLGSLVTAIHVVVVPRIAAGEAVKLGSALTEAIRHLPAVVLVVLLYIGGMFGGFLLLVIPGIWLSVIWYFGAQVAVLEGRPAWESLRRSRDVVRGRWWRTAALLLLSNVLFGAITGPLLLATGLVDDGLPYVLLAIVYQALWMSISALFGTLLFFDLRARLDAHLYRPASLAEFGGFLPPAPADAASGSPRPRHW